MGYWTGKRVAVTGGAGFIGSHLVEILVREGADVTVLLRPGREVKDTYLAGVADKIAPVNVRLEDEAGLVPVFKGHEHVLSVAALMGGLLYSSQNHAVMFYENLRPFMSVLEAARLADVPKFLVCSTACVYPGDAPTPIKEEEGFRAFPQETNEGYGMAKRMQEYMGMLYGRRYPMHISIARPFNAYGPRDDFDFQTSHVIPALIRKTLKADTEIEVYGTGDATRAFVYAEDFAKGLLAVAEKGPNGVPINVGNGEGVAIRDLVKLVLKVCGREDVTPVFDPTKPEGQKRRMADTTRAEELVGFRCTTPLEEGLRRTVEWFKAEVAAGRLTL